MDSCIADNKLVRLNYRISDRKNAKILEQVDVPVSYIHGQSRMFPKVAAALEGKKAGDTVAVELSAGEFFGPKDPSLIYTDDIENVPEPLRKIGTEVQMQNDRGETKKFTVVKIENGKLTVDGNHPLAGADVVFAVKILSVRDATAEEIAKGDFADNLNPI